MPTIGSLFNTWPSSPTATTGGTLYWITTSQTAATTTTSAWLTPGTAAWNAGYVGTQPMAWHQLPARTYGNFYGLGNSPQEAAVLHMLEHQTRTQIRRPPRFSSSEARRHQELVEQYARAADEQAAAALEHRAATIQGHSDAAKQLAMELLLQHLTPAQRETFTKNKWFIVEGRRSGARYRVRAHGSLVANVDVLNGDLVSHRLCAHCDLRAIPLGDQLLAQKLMLEFDEDSFLQIANRHAA